MNERENARITKADLGIEDHGIFTCFLTLEGGDRWCQGFGGYGLDSYDSDKKKRVGTAEGLNFILELMRTFEVSMWSELCGLYCRVEREGGLIRRIGHITKNRWFEPQKVLESRGRP